MDYKSQIEKIGNIIFEEIENERKTGDDFLSMHDRRSESVNPFYNQMKQGFIIELYYGMPSTLYTKYGKVSIGGSGSGNHKPVIERLKSRLGMELYREKQISVMGEHGEWYKVTHIDDFQLPEPIEKEREDYIEYKEAKEQWNKLFNI